MYCIGGSITGRDVCVEICGDGIDALNYECDDGNLVNIDGCSQACQVELGFFCWGGNFAINFCDEICGDGMARGLDDCDDENFVDGDGCDANCNTEFGWICYADNNYLSSICYPITWPMIIDYFVMSTTTEYIKELHI
jgi:cysteine-rich repeat protein